MCAAGLFEGVIESENFAEPMTQERGRYDRYTKRGPETKASRRHVSAIELMAAAQAFDFRYPVKPRLRAKPPMSRSGAM